MRHYSATFLALFTVAAVTTASPNRWPAHVKRDYNLTATHSTTYYNNTCTADNVSVRKEWRSLNDTEKLAYIDAELCLMDLPGQSGLPGASTRFYDLTAMHQQFTNTSDGDIIHGVGQFLPFHRYFMYMHEQLLKTECNYTGVHPWWDESKDSATGQFFDSDVFDNVTGFGGNGTGADHCVTSGPFANRTMTVGPDEETTDYCFSRDWNNTQGVIYASQEELDYCDSYNDFGDYNPCTLQGPHSSGHGGVAGVMLDVAASPGDPIFYMHHTYLDRYWWQWQQANASERLYAMSGYTTSDEPATGWVNTTLDYVMHSFDIFPNTTVGSVMDIQGGYLCYEYDY
ncbi:Tyrosinase ustQ [Lachnellula arida]|uniref:Tyrosinase ustQ n=1 Tax=Lachnellula arida TaxID=1316785 RepID=A0A8T9BDH5_9HELO|nr:Tyrosinase ustQ [Lachnellula arida]